MNGSFQSLKETFGSVAGLVSQMSSLEFIRCGENNAYGQFAIMASEVAGRDYQIMCTQMDLLELQTGIDGITDLDAVSGLKEIEAAHDDLVNNYMKYRDAPVPGAYRPL